MGEKEQSVENKMNERIGQDKRERERERLLPSDKYLQDWSFTYIYTYTL